MTRNARPRFASTRNSTALSIAAIVGSLTLAGGSTAWSAPDSHTEGSPSVTLAGGVTSEVVAEETSGEDISAFFGAGYLYEDAVALARLWNLSDPYAAKTLAGQELLAGRTVPSVPAGPSIDLVTESAAVERFAAAGYQYGAAVQLAEMWKLADPYQAKVRAGNDLLDGGTLPLQP